MKNVTHTYIYTKSFQLIIQHFNLHVFMLFKSSTIQLCIQVGRYIVSANNLFFKFGFFIASIWLS